MTRSRLSVPRRRLSPPNPARPGWWRSRSRRPKGRKLPIVRRQRSNVRLRRLTVLRTPSNVRRKAPPFLRSVRPGRKAGPDPNDPPAPAVLRPLGVRRLLTMVPPETVLMGPALRLRGIAPTGPVRRLREIAHMVPVPRLRATVPICPVRRLRATGLTAPVPPLLREAGRLCPGPGRPEPGSLPGQGRVVPGRADPVRVLPVLVWRFRLPRPSPGRRQSRLPSRSSGRRPTTIAVGAETGETVAARKGVACIARCRSGVR